MKWLVLASGFYKEHHFSTDFLKSYTETFKEIIDGISLNSGSWMPFNQINVNE